jgi:outer membrane biosynthesis protein TonB
MCRLRLQAEDDEEDQESSDEDDDLDYSFFVAKSGKITKVANKRPAKKKATSSDTTTKKPLPKAKPAVPKPATTEETTVRKRRVGLTREIWKSLDEDEQAAWDTLSEESKVRVLKYGMSLATNAPPPAKRQVKVTEISDLIDEPDDDEYGFDTPEDTLLQAYAADSSDFSHGSIEKLLGRIKPPE